MFGRLADAVYRFRLLIVPVWLVVLALAVLLLPKLSTVVAEQGTTYLPDSNPVIQAQKLSNQVNPKAVAKSTVLVAVERDSGLTAADETYFNAKLAEVQNQSDALGVTTVTDAANTDASLKYKFFSKDHTMEIGMVGFGQSVGDVSLPKHLDNLRQIFSSPPAGAHVYFTGDGPIQLEDMQISQNGADRTAVVTVILVLAILLVVFRSVLAPVVTLLAIGLSFLLSSSVVAGLAKLGLPVSTFTQTFLIAVLFGAGTDYSIILLNRYREELIRHPGDKRQALRAVYMGVSKTVLFSSLTVMVSFAALGFATFGLYKSAVGVSIGVTLTLLTCLVFIPALMAIFGPSLYWPRKPTVGAGHGDSRLWRGSAGWATRWPWRTLACLVVVMLPLASLAGGERSFNPMLDIPQASAVQGFNAVSKAFGPGEALPTTVVLRTDSNLRTSDGLATVQKISEALKAVSGVQEVDSATQPAGSAIEDFELSAQNQRAAQGLSQVGDGLGELGNQLTASGQQAKQGTADVQKLADGAQKLQQGAKQVNQGAVQLASSARQLGDGANGLASGLSQVNQGLASVAQGASSLQASQTQLADAAAQLNHGLQAWAAQHPSDGADPDFQKLLGLAASLQSGSEQAATGTSGLAAGMSQSKSGLDQLQKNLTQWQQGVQQWAQGAGELAGATGQLASGSAQVASGTVQLPEQLNKTAAGLQSAGQAARKLQNGVAQVNDYLRSTQAAASSGDPGFHVPADVVNSNSQLKQAMDAYISPDGHVAKFSVVLKNNPYSSQAMATMAPLQTAAETALAASPVHTGTVYVGGTTAVQEALEQVSAADFNQTMAAILAAIFLLLAFLLRSLIAPLYVIASLAGTYAVTMGCLQTIVVHVLHKPGMSWSVPFFVFLLLVALGVDYSIFLMSRFDEIHRGGTAPVAAIREAMGRMGNVIFSAIAIMAGTFGSMVVAGVTSLVEIGLSVLIGLLLYAAVFLAFFIPACVRVVGRGHGWPFAPGRAEGNERSPVRVQPEK